MVQQADTCDEPDCLKIKNRCGVRINTHLRRVAGDQHQVPQPKGVCTDQIHLECKQIPVPAAYMNDRFDGHLPFYEQRERGRRHPAGGTGTVSYVDRIDPLFVKKLRSLHGFRCVNSFRRIQLHGNGKFLSQNSTPRGTFLDRNRRQSFVRLFLLEDRNGHQPTRLDGPEK